MNQYFGKDSHRGKTNAQVENEPSEPERDSEIVPESLSSDDLAYINSPEVR